MVSKIRSYLYDRIKRLVKDGVLNTLDYKDLETYVDCIKGKQTIKVI